MRKGVVKVVVSDPDARQRVIQILEPHRVAIREYVTLPSSLDPAAILLVHDLAPWSDAVLGALRRLRRGHPELHLFLYHPPTRDACALAAIAAQLSLVSAWAWRPDDDRHGPLRDYVRTLLHRSPIAWTIHHFCRQILPDLPDSVHDFLTATVDHLDHGDRTVLWTATMVHDSGWGLRTIERDAEHTGLPCPGDLLRWLILLHVALAWRTRGGSLTRAAAHIGVTEERFRRIRKRLMPNVPASAFTPNAVAAAFQEACGRARPSSFEW